MELINETSETTFYENITQIYGEYKLFKQENVGIREISNRQAESLNDLK